MKLSLKIIGPHLGKPLGAREQNARYIELANALKVVADTLQAILCAPGAVRH
jgi:hypothetical protein